MEDKTLDEIDMELNETVKVRWYDASDVIYVVAFIFSSLAAFYMFSMASIDLWSLLTMLFSMTISVDEITAILFRLIPFMFLFPIPFTLSVMYGIAKKHFNYLFPLAASIITTLLGLMFFPINLMYILFSLAYIASSIVCGYWSYIRYKELKNMKIYRASTRSASRAYMLIKIGIILAIFISLTTDESKIDDFMESSIDSYAAFSLKMSEKQLKNQVADGFMAQKDIQKDLLSNLTVNVADVYKAKGAAKIEQLKQKENKLIDDSDLTDDKKIEVKNALSLLLDQEKTNWINEVEAEKKRLKTAIEDKFENETYQKEMIASYEEKMAEEMLTEENVKSQIRSLLTEPINIEGREVVMYDFIKTTFPLFVIFILWGILGIWAKIMFAPLVGVYSTALAKIILKDEGELK